MPRVSDLTALYESFLYGPRAAQNVCTTCFNFTDGYDRCYACTHNESWLDAVAPISYSPAHEQLHHVLATYKRQTGAVAGRFAVDLAALLWRYLSRHERCLAAAAGTEAFTVVTTVPSGNPERDRRHPLRRIVGELVTPTRPRHERLLKRSPSPATTHSFSAHRYDALRTLDGETVLLVDDTWTTGANAQSAAAALKRAGAVKVGVVVIGRHVNREWRENDRRLTALAGRFTWDECALCAAVDRPQAAA
jgi:predicted amidophosphoribosyltransferase